MLNHFYAFTLRCFTRLYPVAVSVMCLALFVLPVASLASHTSLTEALHETSLLLAQATLDAGVSETAAPVTPPSTPQLPADVGDVGAWLQLLFTALMAKNWWLVASLMVVTAVAGARKWAPEQSELGVLVRSKLGGLASNFLLSFGGTVSTMLLAGQPFTLSVALRGVTVALAAAGGWAIFKNVKEALGERKAQKAGAEAAKDPGPTLNG